MVNISIGTAALSAILGYAVVFFGIVLLMCVITLEGKVFANRTAKSKASESVVQLAPINVPKGVDPKKVAIIAATIAEEQRRR